MDLLLGNGSLHIWVVLVGENSGYWGSNLSEWVSLIESLLSISLSVNSSDRWDLEGLFLSLLSGNSSLEVWLISVGRVEHSLDVSFAVWVLLLSSLGKVVVMVVLFDRTDLDSIGLEAVQVDIVKFELSSRDGSDKGCDSNILEHFEI